MVTLTPSTLMFSSSPCITRHKEYILKFTSKKILAVLIALLSALIEQDDEIEDAPKPTLPEYKLPEDKSI